MLVKMTNMNSESYNKMSSTLRITISYPRFIKLKESAKNTIGNEDYLLILELNTFLDVYIHLDSKIKELQDNNEKRI